MPIPIAAGPDTVCVCGHWWEEHSPEGCAGCDASGQPLSAIEHTFSFDPAQNTPEAIADRGGDPDLWPAWVKEALKGS